MPCAARSIPWVGGSTIPGVNSQSFSGELEERDSALRISNFSTLSGPDDR